MAMMIFFIYHVRKLSFEFNFKNNKNILENKLIILNNFYKCLLLLCPINSVRSFHIFQFIFLYGSMIFELEEMKKIFTIDDNTINLMMIFFVFFIFFFVHFIYFAFFINFLNVFLFFLDFNVFFLFFLFFQRSR